MMNDRGLTQEDVTAGDVAVDGLFAGVAAAILMAAYLVVVGFVAGEGPATVLARFGAGEVASPAVGALSHLAVGGVYGILFALGWRLVASRRWNVPAWLGGLAYVAVLFLLAEVIILPATDSPVREIPVVHWGVAHGIYGLVLGLLVGRQGSA